MPHVFRFVFDIFYIIKRQLLFRVFSLLVSIFVLGSGGIFLFEYGKNDQFKTPFDVIYFMVVTMSTVGYGDKSPTTLGGQVTIIICLCLTVGAIAAYSAIAAASFIESKVKEEMGMKSVNIKNHVAIVGWNYKGPKILEMIHLEQKNQKIVIIADLDRKPVDSAFVHFVKSNNPVNVASLKDGSVDKASSIIILANYDIKVGADAVNAVNAMLCRKVNPSAQIIAELLAPSSREYLEVAGCNYIIGIGEIGGALLAATYLGKDKVTSFWDELSNSLGSQS